MPWSFHIAAPVAHVRPFPHDHRYHILPMCDRTRKFLSLKCDKPRRLSAAQANIRTEGSSTHATTPLRCSVVTCPKQYEHLRTGSLSSLSMHALAVSPSCMLPASSPHSSFEAGCSPQPLTFKQRNFTPSESFPSLVVGSRCCHWGKWRMSTLASSSTEP